LEPWILVAANEIAQDLQGATLVNDDATVQRIAGIIAQAQQDALSELAATPVDPSPV
jgi:hypothetical protein